MGLKCILELLGIIEYSDESGLDQLSSMTLNSLRDIYIPYSLKFEFYHWTLTLVLVVKRLPRALKIEVPCVHFWEVLYQDEMAFQSPLIIPMTKTQINLSWIQFMIRQTLWVSLQHYFSLNSMYGKIVQGIPVYFMKYWVIFIQLWNNYIITFVYSKFYKIFTYLLKGFKHFTCL